MTQIRDDVAAQAKALGIDPIHLGVIIGLSTLIGLVTPPVVPGLYIVMVQTGIRMGELFRATMERAGLRVPRSAGQCASTEVARLI